MTAQQTNRIRTAGARTELGDNRPAAHARRALRQLSQQLEQAKGLADRLRREAGEHHDTPD